AQATIVINRVWRSALRACDQAAELDQVAFVVADKNLVQVLGRQTRLPRQLGHDEVFLAADFDAAEVQSAEENLHRARNILDAYAQRCRAAAVNADAQLRLVHLKVH